MNSTPVTLFNLSGARVVTALRLEGSTRTWISALDPAALEAAILPGDLYEQLHPDDLLELGRSGAALSPEELEAYEELAHPPTPFSRIRDWLGTWGPDDCPGLEAFLAEIDGMGMPHNIDLKVWLTRWTAVGKQQARR